MYRSLKRWSLLPAVAVLACYRYVPAVQTPPTTGSEVRAHLTAEGTQTLASVLGADIAALDGRILSDDGGGMRFSVSQTHTRAQRRTSWTGEPVTVPRNFINKMELRTLDRGRTIRAGAVYAVGGVALGIIFKGLAGSSGSGETKSPPPQQ
jgi:hypothetical protein